MEEKDDFDVFVEKADQVVRRWEAGEDIVQEIEQLKAEVHRVDPSSIPSPSVDPASVCKVLANLQYSDRPSIFHDVRSHREAKQPNKIITNSSLQSNQSSYFRISILFVIFSLLTLYYFNSPRPCPRPIW